MSKSNERPIAKITDILPTLGRSMEEHEEQLAYKEVKEVAKPIQESNDYALTVPTGDNVALQQQYIVALMKSKPGMDGKSTQLVARDLVNSGLQPTEALMIINMVYGGPNGNLSGKGQATRTKYFSEAVQEVWGDRLANASQHPALFRGLLAKMNAATQLHDAVAEENNPQSSFPYSISFKEALLLQDAGVDEDYFLSLVEDLVSEYRISRPAAKIRIVDAAGKIKMHEAASLENILFPIKPSESDKEHYEQ